MCWAVLITVVVLQSIWIYSRARFLFLLSFFQTLLDISLSAHIYLQNSYPFFPWLYYLIKCNICPPHSAIPKKIPLKVWIELCWIIYIGILSIFCFAMSKTVYYGAFLCLLHFSHSIIICILKDSWFCVFPHFHFTCLETLNSSSPATELCHQILWIIFFTSRQTLIKQKSVVSSSLNKTS